MTFTEAAAEVLRLSGKALHFKDITQLAIEKNLLSHVGKTPDVTMGARLSLAIKKEPDGPIVRLKPGVFALREWEGASARRKKKSSGEGKGSPESQQTEPPAAPVDDDSTADDIAALASSVDAAETAARSRPRGAPAPAPQQSLGDASPGEDEETPPLDEEERMRGQLAAGATDLFEEEDDDDQPLFGTPEQPGAPTTEGGRRRRRRRRRGKGREDAQLNIQASGSGGAAAASGSLQGSSNAARLDDEEETIGVTIGDARDEQPTRRAIVLERVPPAPPGRERGRQQEYRQPNFQRAAHGGGGAPQGRDQGREQGRDQNRDRDQARDQGRDQTFDLSASPAFEGVELLDELAGRDLADVVVSVLQTSDRNQGSIPVRAIADAAVRRGKVSGDPQMAVSAIASAVRADNLRRAAAGQRARFRVLPGGRIALTDWVLGSELLRLEQDALAAVDRYRDGARRALATKLQKDMSGPALVELLLLVLERIGFRDIRPVRRAGLPGGESHFSGIHVTAADEIRTAIVLRRDGREIGRERVIDLRGSLHHYGPASAGWLITTGQCLSGAREEASSPGTTPIALFDSLGFARLLEEHGVGVVSTRVELAFPDVDLFEALRGQG